MNIEELMVRLRSALDQWFVLFTVVALVLSLAGGWLALATYGEPTVETEEETYDAWSTTEGFEHSADVQAQNLVFDVGQTLRNQEQYFTRVAPELAGEYQLRYEAPSGNVSTAVELERVVRATDGDDDTYWSVSESLNRTTATLEPGERHVAPFELDVPALVNESALMEESLGGTPGSVEIAVVAHVSMHGTVDGEEVQQTSREELVVEADEPTYAVTAPRHEQETIQRTQTIELEAESTPFGPVVGSLLLIGSLSVLGLASMAKYRGSLRPSGAEIRTLQARSERQEFDEWITRGTLPETVRQRSRIEVADLEGLVDVAIDCDGRVIEDRSADEIAYYVVDRDVLYVYTHSVVFGRDAGDTATE